MGNCKVRFADIYKNNHPGASRHPSSSEEGNNRDAELILLDRNLAQRRMQDDLVPAAVQQRFRVGWRVELVIRDQSLTGPYRNHRKLRNNLLRLERRPLDGHID